MGEITFTDIANGSGTAAEYWRTLRFHYVMTRPGGEVVDATSERPFTFSLLPDHTGWICSLVGMRAGGRRRLHVPAQRPRRSLGESSALYDQDLVIEVHLVEVDPQPVALSSYDTLLGKGPAAAWGDTVTVHYTAALLPNYSDLPAPEHGHLGPDAAFLHAEHTHSTMGGEPRVVVLGSGGLMPGLEDAIIGMCAEGQRRARLSPDLTGGEAMHVWIELLAVQPAPFVLS